MDLDIQPVRLSLREYKQVKQLYMRAFPKYEREPWTWLLVKSKYQRAAFMAFYDQKQFVGFAYVIHSHGMHYILYLAVNDQIRSQGYGTRIINELRRLYPEDSLALDVEQPNPQAANNQQRLRRLKFYRRNGFFPTPKLFKEEKVTFQVLATNKKINQGKIDKAFEWFSWPLGWLIQ
ncbi:GNAT family N-acetyltransferase [Limosilactobacillus reuteri]|uniref:GNAT family N-acetyltransferase n=1 Tax=Limosilactobacillus reuteri TaxID=1598 RepID=UPI00214CAD50|nr:GNAT family N-acetyltransferase [Limosilactobacillus reuteri]MCR1877714.1 GNAT family N-acetyltransferase [Limosilactobacillus reuteri]